MRVIKDMCVKTFTNCNGILMAQWHMKQCVQPSKSKLQMSQTQKNFGSRSFVPSDTPHLLSHNVRTDGETESSSRKQDGVIPGEVEFATNKVFIKKAFDKEAEKKIFNLNSVSATCPVMNLQKNNYNELYLKANQHSRYLLQNKQRIRTYLRETPNLQLRTLQQLEQAFLKCDKLRTG